MTTGRSRVPLVVLSLIGLGASTASAYVHHRLLTDPGYTSFCDVSASVNCESVYRSAYGTVAGVPVAVFGMLWFALALLLTFVSDHHTPEPAGRAGSSRKTPVPTAHGDTATGYLFILSTAALAVVLYMAYASFFVLKTLCILCLTTYAAVIGIFLLSGARGARLGALPAAAGRDLRRLVRSPIALTLAIVYLAGAASVIAYFSREPVAAASAEQATAVQAPAAVPESQAAQFGAWMDAQTRVPLAIPNDGAKVLIVKFNDYQCPPCRQTYMEYKPIIAKYQASNPGQVKFVTKDFPLEAECNTGGVHVAACEAAAAVRMARTKNKADAFEDWLFENQGSMSPDQVRTGLSRIAGINDFDAQYPRYLEQVRGDVALGRQLGVNRTPTFFINGIKVEGGLRPEYFDAAIAHELKRPAGAAENP